MDANCQQKSMRGRRSKFHFYGLKSLKGWLQFSPDGRQLLDQLIGEEIAFNRKAKEQCLVVLHADATVEVYASDGCTVAMRTRLDTEGLGPDCYTKAETYLASTLPLAFHKVFRRTWRTMGKCESVTAERELQRLADTEWLDILRQYSKQTTVKKPRRVADEGPVI